MYISFVYILYNKGCSFGKAPLPQLFEPHTFIFFLGPFPYLFPRYMLLQFPVFYHKLELPKVEEVRMSITLFQNIDIYISITRSSGHSTPSF